MYQKEVIYMSLFHNDIKERNAGYLKVDKRGDAYRLELQVKNVSGAMTGNFPIRLQSETGWQEAAALIIEEGNGKWHGSIAEPVLRVEVLLSDVQKIKGESKLAKAGEPKEEQQEQTTQTTEAPEELSNRSKSPDRSESDRNELPTERVEQPVVKQEKPPVEAEPPETVTEPFMRAESMSSRQQRSIPVKTLIKAERILVKPEHTPLYENKWEQLLTTYEQIHPYGDNRIYVKLAPKDFIILRENYQHLVNNSFLLHGFYNYRYLILGKEKDFYLGVPGVFYEREKMVALMFGFEAFECEGGKAEEGKFGYYLRKVEL